MQDESVWYLGNSLQATQLAAKNHWVQRRITAKKYGYAAMHCESALLKESDWKFISTLPGNYPGIFLGIIFQNGDNNSGSAQYKRGS